MAAVILVVLARPVGLLGEESGGFPAMGVCAPIEELVALAGLRVTRDLTPEEWRRYLHESNSG